MIITGSTTISVTGYPLETADFTGTVLAVGNSLTVNGNGVADFGTTAFSVNTLSIVGGELDAGDVTVANQFVWYGGTVGGTGTR